MRFDAILDPGPAEAYAYLNIADPWIAWLVYRGEMVSASQIHHPLHTELAKPLGQRYYWSASESEFATDVCFKDAASLAKLYPQFLHHGIRSFSSPDVLRFLGKRAVQSCQGEVKSTLKHRAEGVRIRHMVNGNSIKV